MSSAEARLKSNLILERMDLLIRSGRQGEVRNLLLEMNWSQIPRGLAVEFADIARRVNTPKVILLILKNIVYPEVQNHIPATVRERALYASGLSRLGVYVEAEKILSQLDSRKDPQVILFRAFNDMFQWNSAEAAVRLKKYIAIESLDPYSRLVGQVNLVACLVQRLNWDEATAVLNQIWLQLDGGQKAVGPPEKFRLLYANSLELSAQMHVCKFEFNSARKLLLEAEKMLDGTRSRYELYIKKWKYILALLENPKSPKALEDLRIFCHEALLARDFEVARDCEFFQAFALQDDSLFLKLYHGSGFKSYRRRIEILYQPKARLTDPYIWTFGNASQGMRVFNLWEGREIDGRSALARSQLSFRLLQALTEDFYRPLAKGTMISRLYPDEHFNPITSPQKAVKVVADLRNWIRRNSLPLKLHCRRGEYQLRAHESFGFLISPKAKLSPLRNREFLDKLRSCFNEKNFSTKDAAAVFEVSERTARRFLLEARKEGQVLQLRGGRTALYRLKISSLR